MNGGIEYVYYVVNVSAVYIYIYKYIVKWFYRIVFVNPWPGQAVLSLPAVETRS